MATDRLSAARKAIHEVPLGDWPSLDAVHIAIALLRELALYPGTASPPSLPSRHCEACGCANNADGSCTRPDCCNSD